MTLPLVVEISGRDRLEVVSLKPFQMKVIGCDLMWTTLLEMKSKHGTDLTTWPLPSSTDHVSLLLKELILKLQGNWQHPYPHLEVCHCRNVPLATVEEAIFAGAHSPEMVSRWTSASTACGTCRPDVVKILEFRLGRSMSKPSK